MGRNRKRNKKKGKVSPAVKAYVKHTIDAVLEDKQITTVPGAPGVPISTSFVPGAQTSFLINGVAQGTDIRNRIGDSIRVKWWEAIGYLEDRNADPELKVPFFVRVLAVVDHQPNGAEIDDLLVLNTLGNAFNSPLNVQHVRTRSNKQGRYTVVMDKSECITIGGGSTNLENRRAFHYRFGAKNMKTIFNANGATIAQIETNALWLIFITENADDPQVRLCLNCVFEDA